MMQWWGDYLQKNWSQYPWKKAKITTHICLIMSESLF